MPFDVGSAVGYLLLDITGWKEGLSTAKSALKTFSDSSATALDKTTALGKAMTGIGTGLTRTVTAPIVGLGTAAVKTATSWESAWTGVTKTVDGTTEQMEDLEKALFDISKRTASMPDEVAAVAEAAGQLGIATENIAGFAETMVQLGDTTNLSADEAATSLARFANITGMSQTEFDKLGSTIVDLGNNFATTEAEIVAMGSRLAGAGTQIGLTESEIMGFAAALSSVGIEAEAGGTAMSKVFVDMQLAVETGSDRLNDFAAVAGMTASQFSQAFREDAAGAIQAFIQGLANSESRGVSAIAVLDEMGISEVRLRDALLRASGASEIFGDAIATANTAWEENVALTEEAEKRYGTTESRIAQLKASIYELGVQFGELLLPIVEDLVAGISAVVEWLNSLDEGTKKTIVTVALVAAAIGPVLVMIGKLITSVTSIISLISGAGGLTAAFGAIATAVTGPLGIAIAAVVAFAAAWATNFGGIRDKTAAIMESIKSVIDSVLGAIKTIWENDLFGIRTVVEDVFGTIQQLVSDAMDVLVDIFEVFVALFSGDWEALGEALKNLVSDFINGVMNLLGNLLNLLVEFILGMLVDLAGALRELLTGLWNVITEKWDSFIAWLEEVKEDPLGVLMSIGQALYDLGRNLFQYLWDGLKDLWQSIVDWVQEKVDWLVDKIKFWDDESKKLDTDSVGDKGGGGFSGSGGSRRTVQGSYASGLDYAPRDMDVTVHEGERILTKKENELFPDTAGNAPQDIHFDLSIPLDGQIVAHSQYTYNAREGTLRGQDLVTGRTLK